MKTATDLMPFKYVYQEINEGKYKSTKHYELVDKESICYLSDKLNISRDRMYAKSNPDYWLKVRETTKWSHNITGLFKTNEKYLFKGDMYRKKDLLLFKFSDSAKTLTVYYFKGFYTQNIDLVLDYISE